MHSKIGIVAGWFVLSWWNGLPESGRCEESFARTSSTLLRRLGVVGLISDTWVVKATLSNYLKWLVIADDDRGI